MVVEKRVLMKVVFPNPDSPATYLYYQQICFTRSCQSFLGYRTMIVKAAPRLATILCRWLGKLAMPIGDALSAVVDAGGMVTVIR